VEKFKVKVKEEFTGKTPDGNEAKFEKGKELTEKDIAIPAYESAFVEGWLEAVTDKPKVQ
jgi:hypothetical protein